MLEQTDVIMNEVLEPITFVVAYPPVPWRSRQNLLPKDR